MNIVMGMSYMFWYAEAQRADVLLKAHLTTTLPPHIQASKPHPLFPFSISERKSKAGQTPSRMFNEV